MNMFENLDLNVDAKKEADKYYMSKSNYELLLEKLQKDAIKEFKPYRKTLAKFNKMMNEVGAYACGDYTYDFKRLKKAGGFFSDGKARAFIQEYVDKGCLTVEADGSYKITELYERFSDDCLAADRGQVPQNFYNSLFVKYDEAHPEVQKMGKEAALYRFYSQLADYQKKMGEESTSLLTLLLKEQVLDRTDFHVSIEQSVKTFVKDKVHAKKLCNAGYLDYEKNGLFTNYNITAKGICFAIDIIFLKNGKMPPFMLEQVSAGRKDYIPETRYENAVNDVRAREGYLPATVTDQLQSQWWGYMATRSDWQEVRNMV